jgi:endonuclease/exonuclease/phosphatase family metal-dependent hydrolase
VGYNVRDLLDDRDAVAHVVRSCRPDVLCLQEAPRRPGTLWRTARLARETALRHVAGGRGSGGTAVLVSPRLDVVEAEVARLPVAHWWTRTRGYALAALRLPEGPELTVVSVHLPLDPADRVDHGGRVGARVAGLGGRPLVVSGDLNEEPGGPSWASFGDLCRDAVELDGGNPAVQDGPTYPARSPHRRIDAVLVSPGVRVLALGPAGAAEGLSHADLVAASDHLPLVADLELAR